MTLRLAPGERDRLIASAADPDRRILVAGGTVLTMDPSLGDLVRGDVLVRGERIEAVGADLREAAADGQALVVDAEDSIVLPGFQDTHRHCWQGQLRRLMSNCGIEDYMVTAHDVLAPVYTPDDVYAGCLLSAWGAIDGGVTTVLDFMHNTRTVEYAEAAIRGFADAGIRGVHGAGPPAQGEWDHRWLANLPVLRDRYFATDDQLLTLQLAPFGYPDIDQPDKTLSPELLRVARELGIRTVVDAALGPRSAALVAELAAAGELGPDVTLIHCTEYTDAAWDAIAESGTQVALAVTSDSQLGIHDAIPPIQAALDRGVRPGLSVDVECSLSTDMFAQMQAVVTIQRMLAYQRRAAGETDPPVAIAPRRVLEMATVDGARVNGLDAVTGTLTPGKRADLVVIAGDDVNTMPINSAPSTVVLGADARNVQLVLIDGAVKKAGAELVGCDVGALHAQVAASRDRVLAGAGLDLDLLD